MAGRLWNDSRGHTLYANVAQMRSPAALFVFIDENELGINDGCFFVDTDTRWEIVDYPASYHAGAAGCSFADGHSEIHYWKNPRTMPVLGFGQLLPLNQNYPGDLDADWLSRHASEPR
jgi:prepilin-type processing-associated H-X9-DG protein